MNQPVPISCTKIGGSTRMADLKLFWNKKLKIKPLIATPFLCTERRAPLIISGFVVVEFISISSKSIGAPAYLQLQRKHKLNLQTLR